MPPPSSTNRLRRVAAESEVALPGAAGSPHAGGRAGIQPRVCRPLEPGSAFCSGLRVGGPQVESLRKVPGQPAQALAAGKPCAQRSGVASTTIGWKEGPFCSSTGPQRAVVLIGQAWEIPGKCFRCHLLARIRATNRLELVMETMRFTLNSLSMLVPDWLAGHMQPEWANRYKVSAAVSAPSRYWSCKRGYDRTESGYPSSGLSRVRTERPELASLILVIGCAWPSCFFLLPVRLPSSSPLAVWYRRGCSAAGRCTPSG